MVTRKLGNPPNDASGPRLRRRRDLTLEKDVIFPIAELTLPLFSPSDLYCLIKPANRTPLIDNDLVAVLLNKWSSCTTALHRWNKWSKWLTLSHFSSRREEVMGQLSVDTKSFYIFHFCHITLLKWSAWEKVFQRVALPWVNRGKSPWKKRMFFFGHCPKVSQCEISFFLMCKNNGLSTTNVCSTYELWVS